MPKGIKYFLYILWIPVWWLQKIMPRRRDLWVFGSWYGLKYSDNSKCLFEYISDNHKEIKCVWLTKSVEIHRNLVMAGRNTEMSGSLKGIWKALRARYVVFSSGKNDINPFFINGAIIVNSWHGAPMKKIGQDDKFGYDPSKDRIIKLFFPWIREYGISATISTADVFTQIMCSAFNLPVSNVFCTGYPRNDLFFLKEVHPLWHKWDVYFGNPRKIFYLPTFRGHSGNFQPFNKYGYDEIKMDIFLKASNSILVTKGHFIDKQVGLSTSSDRIIHLNDSEIVDLNFLLKDADILITDYSGVYFDFLLTGKPILFAPFDFEEYLSTHRELYFSYDEVICGPMAKNWNEVIDGLESLFRFDVFEEKRKAMKARFNKFSDGFSSQRLYSALRNR
jgi:CDP-glycerol glycerophosphotransferase (TagB/SpsB family)